MKVSSAASTVIDESESSRQSMQCVVLPGSRYAGVERRRTVVAEGVEQAGVADEVAVQRTVASDVEVAGQDDRLRNRTDVPAECGQLPLVQAVEAVRLRPVAVGIGQQMGVHNADPRQ